MSNPIPINERAPEFPCWAYKPTFGWQLFDGSRPRWLDYSQSGMLSEGWSHWHPDQPTAPTERPEDDNDAFLTKEVLKRATLSPEAKRHERPC